MNEILTQEKSIYIQIKEMIEDDILRDVLLEEERVPSTNELARLYAINPATAAVSPLYSNESIRSRLEEMRISIDGLVVV